MKSIQDEHLSSLDYSKSYTKIVNDHLSISLTYLPSKTSTEFECLLTFHNTNDQSIVINAQEKQQEQAVDTSSGWLSSIFGRGDKELPQTDPDSPDKHHVKLFLGHVQLFGYVVLNYNFNIDTSSLEMTKNSQWWNNIEYLDQYFNNQDLKDEDLQIKALNQVPLISHKSKLIIEGKLGGVNDLVVADHNRDILIDGIQTYFLHDLITPFNSQQTPASTVATNTATISLSDLTNSIVSIYSTRQSLLFTNLDIEPNSCKTFHFKFPVQETLPPSYNTRSTGIACDQGWSSIRYSLIVSVSESKSSEKLTPRSIYFPVNVQAQRVGINFRYLQYDYLSNDTAFQLDSHWKIELVSKETKGDIPEVKEPRDAREVFLQDLTKLITSDLYNMPKVSTIERRKSSIHFEKLDELNQLDICDTQTVPQLPEHLKTQYQLRVNNQELCLISLSRPYFHIGDDINYIIDINKGKPYLPKVIGIVTYLEAHEMYHIGDTNRVFTNMYKVSGNEKLNTFASSMIDSCIEKQTPSLVNGYIHIPRSLTGQFQSSSFMDLKYFLVFHFNLATFAEEEKPKEGTEEGERLVNGELKINSSEELFGTNRQFKFDGVGSGHKFKVPIYLLP